MVMGEHEHFWGGGLINKVKMYGYGLMGSTISFPGPTILAAKNVPLQITWYNNISGPHILDAYIEPSLMAPPASCYPGCGVPLITHVHGMEVPAENDGVPYQAVYYGNNRTDTYNNSQMSSTHLYHDHAMGLTRLNSWSGLLGGFIISDPNSMVEQQMHTTCDIPLVITDTIISPNATLLYPTNDCTLQQTKWVPESYGTVNAVNGIVMPFVNVPQQQCRLRLINGANSRNFGLNIPFFDTCKVIASDMGFVNTPYSLSSANDVLLYPLERVELMCDFRSVSLNTAFNVTDVSYTSENEQSYSEIFQLRVARPPDFENDGSFEVPVELNAIKDLKEAHAAIGGLTRNITLAEVVDEEDCPVQLLILENNVSTSYLEDGYIECVKGTVERWNFMNPSADVHPFHWHAISVQCGPSDDAVDTNELKDTVPIPSAEGEYETVTQVCYVACTPNDYLVEDSTTDPKGFAFDTAMPYVVHCHMLEHEENAMMTYFLISDGGEIVADDETSNKRSNDGDEKGLLHFMFGSVIGLTVTTALVLIVLGGIGTILW